MAESKSGMIRLPREKKITTPEPAIARVSTAPPGPRPEPTEAEVRSVIAAREGNLLRAAADLGLPSRYSLYRLLKKLGVTLDDVRSEDPR